MHLMGEFDHRHWYTDVPLANWLKWGPHMHTNMGSDPGFDSDWKSCLETLQMKQTLNKSKEQKQKQCCT